jgi:hypothetical protein
MEDVAEEWRRRSPESMQEVVPGEHGSRPEEVEEKWRRRVIWLDFSGKESEKNASSTGSSGQMFVDTRTRVVLVSLTPVSLTLP